MSEHLGKIDFLDTPTVNGSDVLLNAGGVPSVSSGPTASRPAAALVGRLYLDTTTSRWYRDNGSSWDDVSQVPTNVDGTANQINVVDGQPSVVSIADNPVLPGLQGLVVPGGATADRSLSPSNGTIRYNSTLSMFEGYQSNEWAGIGEILQLVTGDIAAATFTSTQIPLDNTTPLSTEGSQFFSVTFTPVSAFSRIVVEFPLTVASSTAARTVIIAVFRGTTIIGSAVSYAASASVGYPLSFMKSFSPGSKAPITITGRCGLNSTGNTSINIAGASTLGGSAVSQYRIMEVRA